MKRALFAGGIISVAVYLTGCAEPETLYRADPVSNNTVWYSGEEYQTKTKDSLSVSVAFENEFGGAMTFYMAVGNLGSDTVLVAPEKFYFYGTYQKVRSWYDYRTGYPEYDTTKGIDTTFAIDPERQLAGIDQQAAQANATYSTNNGLNAAAALLNLVGNIATIGKNETEAQRKEERHQQHSLDESEEENQNNYASKMDQLNSQRDYWQNTTLRKTTLFPSTAIGGKVSFPVNPYMQTFKLIVPIDTMTIEFDFKQKRVGN
jgi:hypothetical protein